MVTVALTKAERKMAADLIQKVLDLVDDGYLAADGPAGVALVRRLEGAAIALRGMDSTMTAVVQTERNGRPRVPDSS
jgi:hypothetical protein